MTPPVGLPMPTAVDPLPDFTSAPTVRTVVIDAGHGGEEDGARGPVGTLEKDITLSVARRLRDAIESRLGLRVILTRNRDETVDLDERAAIANNNKADLFISFHANASTHPGPEGAAVFYLSIDEYGEEARELAGREGQTIPVVGGGTREIDLILWEMAQVRYLEHSAQFAGYVEGELGRRVTMSQGAIQQAPFRVLVGANMPAVLVEMGFISNPRQETRDGDGAFSAERRRGRHREHPPLSGLPRAVLAGPGRVAGRDSRRWRLRPRACSVSDGSELKRTLALYGAGAVAAVAAAALAFLLISSLGPDATPTDANTPDAGGHGRERGRHALLRRRGR